MSHEIESKLTELGLALPEAPAPAANYVPFVQTGNLVFVSGQISKDDTGLITGTLGEDADVSLGQKAAASCALALLAQLKAACNGDLGRLVKVVKLTGFVNSAPSFTDHPAVINGASDLLGEVLGEKGAHARAAVGVSALPLNVAVEIEGIFEIK